MPVSIGMVGNQRFLVVLIHWHGVKTPVLFELVQPHLMQSEVDLRDRRQQRRKCWRVGQMFYLAQQPGQLLLILE